MMKYYFEQVKEDLKTAVRELMEERGFIEAVEGIGICFLDAKEEQVLNLSVSSSRIEVTAGRKAYFFRGLSKALQVLQKGSLEKEVHMTEEALFSSCGSMYDCSRNGVLKVDTIKHYVRKSAQLGLNTIMLYIEDTYEIKEYPYFGYMRGRYTAEELKACDDYADQFGIELIPCIQTLAHLHTPLRFPVFRELQDTGDILLVGSEKVYALIESMLSSVASCFRSNKIHLGMDEAHELGLGEYLRQYGFTERFDIMNAHLKRIKEMCDAHQLVPAIWSDMYFRLLSPTGDYYDIPKDKKPEDMVKPPEGIELVYWDYYHKDKEKYCEYIKLHHNISNMVSFAGGGWTWNGLAPNYARMLETTNAGLQACKEEKLTSVVCTLWQDNGAETPMEAGDPAMVLYAEHCFHDKVDMEQVKENYHFVFHRKWEDSMLLDQFDNVQGTLPNNANGDDPSKYMFYQDPLVGLFDGQINGFGMKAHYVNLEKALEKLDDNGNTPLFAYYKTLAKVLVIKAELGLEMRSAYLTSNKESLHNIAENSIPNCIKEVKTLLEYRRKLWYQECKSFGFEVLDIKFSGVIARLESTKIRLAQYLTGEVTVLEELEEERLVYCRDEKNPQHTQCNCSYWQNIISAGNIAGI